MSLGLIQIATWAMLGPNEDRLMPHSSWGEWGHDATH